MFLDSLTLLRGQIGKIEDESISCISNNAAALETITIDPRLSYQHEPSSWPPEAVEANKVAEDVLRSGSKESYGAFDELSLTREKFLVRRF
ncbi:hypothetical protein LINPERPRIM_LOCUS9299 [Linum perenne]